MSAPTINEMISAVSAQAREHEGSEATCYSRAAQDRLAEVLDAAAETLKRMQWQPIETAPTDRPIALVVQFYDASGQRIIPTCEYLGCPYTQPNDDYALDELGEFATHWREPIELPPAIPTQGAKAQEKADA